MLLMCVQHAIIMVENQEYNYDREESIERRHTVHQMYAESNVTSCICHGLGICTCISNYITHTWSANSKPIQI